MLKKITLKFEYDGTTQGNIDRDAFKSSLDTETLKNTIVPIVHHGVHTETSSATLNGNTLSAVLFYTPTNAGITDFNSYWSTVVTEYAKTTVVKVGNVSSGNKHNCNHDATGNCNNFTSL